MSVIKEMYDVAKDGAALVTKTAAIKRALKAELKLNKKLLSDIENAEKINNKRRVEIIKMLDVSEVVHVTCFNRFLIHLKMRSTAFYAV